jgi:endonuclease YncB( thermonuclease family)
MTNNYIQIIAPDKPSPDAVEVPVLKVFDGDGFLTRMKARQPAGNSGDQSEVEVSVRFGFVDAPELEQPGGIEAKQFLNSLIGGRKVWIDILTKMDTGRSVDRYDRLVCVPYLEQRYSDCMFAASGNYHHRAHPFSQSYRVMRNIELEMVLNGWAWVLERYRPDCRYFEALDYARSNKRGIWSLDNNIDPWAFKRQKALSRDHYQTVPATALKPQCPKPGCDGHLVKRNGKFGTFLGCSNYPSCRYSSTIAAHSSF